MPIYEEEWKPEHRRVELYLDKYLGIVMQKSLSGNFKLDAIDNIH